MDRNKLETAIAGALESQDAYLVELIVGADNVISLFVDADGGISLQKLKMINREVEAAFDREVEDFELTVSSPGLERPFRVQRQYRNNIGRWVKVKTADGKVRTGKLQSVSEEAIVLEVHPVKKKDPVVEETIGFTDITETKIEIRF
jgi:ribosome maturation factor RimP